MLVCPAHPSYAWGTATHAEQPVTPFANESALPLSLLGGTWSLDVRTYHLRWCPQSASIHGAEHRVAPTARQVLERVAPACRAMLLTAVLDCIGDRKPFELEVDLTTFAGSAKRIRVTGVAAGDSGGRAASVKGLVQEVAMLDDTTCADTAPVDLLDLQLLAYGIPHELRGPLATISGFASALRDRYGDRLDDKGRHWVQRICAAARQLDGLTDSLMKLAPVNAQAMHREDVDLSKLAADAVVALRDKEPHRVVKVDVQGGVRAFGDASLLGLLLANLFSNAWKFTARCAEGRIAFTCRQTGGDVTYTVTDNGVGFSDADAPALFGMFRRLHDRQEFEGSGVGLALARRVVQRHGGTIWAEGEPGAGASFSFRLGAVEPPRTS